MKDLPRGMCGHCFRPATVTIHRSTLARRVLRLAPERFACCNACVSRYVKKES